MNSQRFLLPRQLTLAGLVLCAFLASQPIHVVHAQDSSDLLTSRPLPSAPKTAAIKVGDSIATQAGQRQRLQLPGDMILYINENTVAKLEAPDRLQLSRGEVFVEAVPATKGKPAAFQVQTHFRTAQGTASSFAVQAQERGTGVLVARGKVEVSGLKTPLAAGQFLPPEEAKPQSGARPSQLLHWTRDLMSAAEASLVPESEYSGGALIAIDPEGQETKLELRKYHVDVYIEDGFARTTIDQTYFNHENFQMEGTFYFPLPPDASLSRLAMYVDGQLMEGGMVLRDEARQIYETIRYMRRDPALLEWVDGSTFKMRVFPLEARKEKRIILSYTQKLTSLNGQMEYRFPAGHSLPAVRDWSVNLRVKKGAGMGWTSPSHEMKGQKDNGDLILSTKAKNAIFNKDVVVYITDAMLAGEGARNIHYASAMHEGQRYLLVRLRPDLVRPRNGFDPLVQSTEPKHWLVLFETSGDRDPLLARVQIEVIRHLLSHANPQDTFNILTANTRVRSWSETPQPVTLEKIDEAVAYLEGSHLIGALDLGQALTEVGGNAKRQANCYVVHVGTGIAAMGERRNDVLAKHLGDGTRYIGVGVGRRWNRSLMKLAAERTGGYYTQINPDESISWRAFELTSTIQTFGPSHLRNVAIEMPASAGKQPTRFLHFNQLLTQGEELSAITRLPADQPMPDSIDVAFGDGKRITLPVANVQSDAGALPRMWAKLEIERLLAEDAVEHKDTIVSLSKDMYVMTPYTSLLVLENEDMYKQFNVDRGRKDHWAMYPAPDKVKVVYEPDPSMPVVGKDAKTPQQVAGTVVMRARPGLIQTPQGVGTRTETLRQQRVDEMTTGAFTFGVQGRSSSFNPAMPQLGGFPGKDMKALAPASSVAGQAPREPQLGFQPFTSSGGASGKGGRKFGGLAGAAREEMAGERLHAATQFRGLSDVRLGRGVQLADHEEMRNLAQSENRRQINTEWTRFWPNDNPTQLAYEHISGGLGAGRADVQLANGSIRYGLSGFGSQHFFLRDQDGAIAALQPDQPPTLLYSRPSYSGQDAIFFNLIAYAPGMNTTLADVLAVIEAEAKLYRRPRPGTIDEGARKLIEKARSMGWQSLTLEGEKGQPAITIYFDGQGRYAWERTSPLGMREQVVCDGKTITHLYPQLHLGAKRQVSRFHREDTAAVLPWLVLPAEDFAHGADVKLIDERTVAIVPHIAPRNEDDKNEQKTYQVRLVFAGDGKLAERQLVELPKEKILLRQIIQPNGMIKLLDEKGKELSTSTAKLSPAQPQSLTLNTEKLIVLDLPYRSPQHVRETLKITNKPNEQFRIAEAIPLMASLAAAGDAANAQAVFNAALAARNQKNLGFYVLLASCGVSLDGQNLNVLAEHPDEPLAQFLTLHSSPVLRQHASQWAAGSVQWKEPFLRHLAMTHALYQRWQSGQVEKWSTERRKAERQRALEYARDNQYSAFGWVMLCLLQDRAGEDKAFHRDLAEHFKLFADMPGLRHAARYEEARSLLNAGQATAARQAFEKLYADTLKEEVLPLLDRDFRRALLGDKTQPDAWIVLLQKTARGLIADKNRPAVLALAWQCWQLEDAPQANQLMTMALENPKDRDERIGMNLLAVRFYKQTGQLPQADQLVDKLLQDDKLAQNPGAWRLAHEIASARSMNVRSLQCLGQALDLEFQKLPEFINLEQVRSDYQSLLTHNQTLADSMIALKIKPSDIFLRKVIRTADRWRSLDRDAAQACNSVAAILRTLDNEELAWDYLTTPIAMQPNEAQPWVNLATSLRTSGNLELADKAFKAAYESEPTNAQILWDRAQNLRQAGHTSQAMDLFRQIAESNWQPRFQGLAAQARLQLR